MCCQDLWGVFGSEVTLFWVCATHSLADSREVVKIQNPDFSYWAWSTPWGPLLNLLIWQNGTCWKVEYYFLCTYLVKVYFYGSHCTVQCKLEIWFLWKKWTSNHLLLPSSSSILKFLISVLHTLFFFVFFLPKYMPLLGTTRLLIFEIHTSSVERFSENFDQKAVTYLIFFVGTHWFQKYNFWKNSLSPFWGCRGCWGQMTSKHKTPKILNENL